MPDKVALVTGAGRAMGLGFEVARQLAQRDHAILLAARKPADAEARTAELRAEGLEATPLVLDLTDDASVQAARDGIARLDVLVNNAAGVAPFGETALAADLDVARGVFETTLFGTWALTKALAPLLARSPAPRIVFVSSGAGSHGDPVFGMASDNPMGVGYASSKAALNALAVKVAREMPQARVNAVCPGFTATFEGGEAMGARPVAESARGVVWAATLPDDGPTGGFFRDGAPLPW